ncbi:type I 3-dehydroquinate dehydratase [Bradyrhizobium diazoefficiens]|nr:type I 3-dehydroquinate dehydratase [Bradyrhizobium diazoefficiens]MBR0848854.1 type I 3-dehydroquinate dehydratase [Bradyrhizobium diazoefficiens]
MSGLTGLIVSLSAADASMVAATEGLPEGVAAVRLCVDADDDADPRHIRKHCRLPLICNLRRRADVGSDGARHQRLLESARQFDLVELDADSDLVPHLLSAIEPSRRLISWQGAACDAATLARRLAAMEQVPAALYVLAPRARRFAETFAPLHLLKGLARDDVVAYDTSPAGFWTRVIAPSFGAPAVFVDAAETPIESDPGRITALIDDYDLLAPSPVTALYAIVGCSALRSLSPRLHNEKYRRSGRAAMFVPIPATEPAELCDDPAIDAELAHLNLDLRGLTVVAPFKETALALAQSRSAPAETAGSANLLLRRAVGWRAETTDPQGVLDALAARGVPLRGVPAVVIGCGGAGRAIAAALRDAGASVTLANRTPRAGRICASKLSVRFTPLEALRPAAYSILVNATPVGADGVHSPMDPRELAPNSIVIDLVYGPGVTPLVTAARDRGLTVIDGLEILDHQVRHQYERMAEFDEMREREFDRSYRFHFTHKAQGYGELAAVGPD